MRQYLLCTSSCLMAMAGAMRAEAAPPLLPVVEAESNVYEIGNPDNGAGPLWCYGSTCLARLGKDVFASGLEILPDQKPLNNVRWTLFQLTDKGWELAQVDPTGRQREGCPLGLFADGRLLLTSNPTLTPPGTYNGPAQPQVLVFDTKRLTALPKVLLPQWEGQPAFTEHSYRGLGVDGPNHEALYLNESGYDGIHWSFLDRAGQWSHCGKITVPFGAEFEKPEPIRVCYQNVALRDRAAYVMGVSDIIEPVRAWREYKLILHEGKAWDYDFRRLYYCYTPDLTKEPWQPWVLVADCDQTCGHITNLDVWLDKQGRAHLLWLEQSVWDSRMRDKFFPETPITYALMYGLVDQGKVVQKTRLAFAGEKQESQEIPGYARFQATPEGRLFVFYYCSGADANGRSVSENRLLEIYPDGSFSAPVPVALEHPFSAFMTATERGGSAPSAILDILGQAQDQPGISYARVNLLNKVLAQFDYRVRATPNGSELALDGTASRAAEGKIVSYAWQIGDVKASGPTVKQAVRHGGPVTVALTVKDAQGDTSWCQRTVQRPPAPYDFGLKQWGLVERIEAEGFASEGGGVIHVREDKLNASGLSLSHFDTKGHWLEWEIDVPSEDNYLLVARYAAPTNSARALTVDGQAHGEFGFPSTGGYGSDTADGWGVACLQVNGRPVPLPLTAGKHVLRLANLNGLGLNLGYLDLVAAKRPSPEGDLRGFRRLDGDGYGYLLSLQGALAPTQIRPEQGFCYNYTLGLLFPGDGMKEVPPSTLRMFEDGRELGPAHAVHVDIRNQGQGRYSHWNTVLYFSASDNSDPRTNGRKYTWQVEK